MEAETVKSTIEQLDDAADETQLLLRDSRGTESGLATSLNHEPGVQSTVDLNKISSVSSSLREPPVDRSPSDGAINGAHRTVESPMLRDSAISLSGDNSNNEHSNTSRQQLDLDATGVPTSHIPSPSRSLFQGGRYAGKRAISEASLTF